MSPGAFHHVAARRSSGPDLLLFLLSLFSNAAISAATQSFHKETWNGHMINRAQVLSEHFQVQTWFSRNRILWNCALQFVLLIFVVVVLFYADFVFRCRPTRENQWRRQRSMSMSEVMFYHAGVCGNQRPWNSLIISSCCLTESSGV